MLFKSSTVRVAFLTVGLYLAGEGASWAGTKVVVGRNVPADQRIPIDAIDHTSWDALLRKYVDGQGNVAYTLWKQSVQETRVLDAYLAELSRVDRKRQASRVGRLALWINAYNAVTIRGILREYPTTSIRNHTARLYGYNIWKDLLLQVGEQQLSLEQIEHEVLRKMDEPRIHFAVVCASRSCPKLVNQAYTAENLEQLLSQNTRDFFANPMNFRYDEQRGRIYLSSILNWYSDDFASTRPGLLKAIAPYLPDAVSQTAAAAGNASVSYLKYDWTLNDQKSTRTARR